ncbi:MAG: HAMP domain-containing histidine kinase, partial [Cyanobacteria bacterium]|nr:HAMP domain-containing histidine kinase [Cyanobacteriota bacterium]
TNGNFEIVDSIRSMVAEGLREQSYLLEERTQRSFFWQCISVATTSLLALISIVSVWYLLRVLDKEKIAEQLKHEQVLSRQREDFMAALAHNLRVPMIGIGHVLRGLLSERLGRLEDAQRGCITAMEVSNNEQLLLVERLLHVYTYQENGSSAERSEVYLPTLIEECIHGFRPRAEETRIKLSSQTSDLSMVCDRAAIKVMLNNFIENALKFTPDGGNVTIKLLSEGRKIIFEVTDDGCGFDSGHKEAMFESLWKGPAGTRLAPNIGLGLYLCKQIAEAHSGEVSCTSKAGEGSSFYAIFPIE